MDVESLLLEAVECQNHDIGLDELCFNVFLKSGDILFFCFFEKQVDDTLIVAETTPSMKEELRIVPLENVEYIGICYDLDLENVSEGDETDRMFN